jgi:hypothetical protein
MVLIDGQRIEVTVTILDVQQVAALFRVSEQQVVAWTSSGTFSDVSADPDRVLLDPDEVIPALEEKVAAGQLGKEVFPEVVAYLTGRL